MRTKQLLVLALAALMLVGAECEEVDIDVGDETESPSPGPSPGSVTFSQGEATLSVTGGIEDEVTLPLADDRGDALLVFGDGEPRLEIGGELEEGENPSAEAAVSIAIDGRTFVNELNGPCIVTVTESSDEAIAGHVGCPQLQDGDLSISVSASFRAEA